MTKEEFEQFKKDCKDEWLELSEHGIGGKSIRVKKYLNRCPACHIAALVANYKSSLDSGFEYEHNVNLILDSQDCRFCPITVWRNIAINKKDYLSGEAICEEGDELYTKWVFEPSQKNRMLLAKEISELEWEWLPEYEFI